MSVESPIALRCWPGLLPYFTVLDAMREFTRQRDAQTSDQIWLLQHPPVITLGSNADPTDVLDPGPIPVIRSDRGGQATYHGPGQWLVYTLLDLGRMGIGVRDLISALESAVIDLLASRDVAAVARSEAPGVYVNGAKIASVGLKVHKGCSYHGLSLNVHMDLEPFRRITPCGQKGLAVTQVHDLVPDWDEASIPGALMEALAQRLGRPIQRGGA